MEALSTPRGSLAWTCPDCGHGSPEPRDRLAHLDAHRQLQQFFRDWDDAVTSDAQAAAPAPPVRTRHRRGWWAPPALLALLVTSILGLLVVDGSRGGHRSAPEPGITTPSVEPARDDLLSTAPPPAGQATRSPAVADDRTPQAADAPPPASQAPRPPAQAVAPARGMAADDPPAAPATGAAGSAAPGPAPVAGSAHPTPGAPAAPHLLHTCLLDLVCVTVL